MHFLAEDPEQYRRAHLRVVACYQATARERHPPIERIEVPFEGGVLPGYLRRPVGSSRAPVTILLPGLDAAKEELHA
jgi:2,6-dihydroxypseudooxynicotine hydrolase